MSHWETRAGRVPRQRTVKRPEVCAKFLRQNHISRVVSALALEPLRDLDRSWTVLQIMKCNRHGHDPLPSRSGVRQTDYPRNDAARESVCHLEAKERWRMEGLA